MKSPNQPYLWTALVVAVVLGLVWQYVPLKDARERMDTLPLKGLSYEGEDIPLKAYEEKHLKGSNLLKRRYTVDGKEFFITILDGTKNRHVVHDPYYCFKGSGWEVLSETALPLKNGQASLLQIRKNDQEREALFWFSNGRKQFNSPMTYWWQTMIRRATIGLSGEEPVLIVVQPLQGDKVDWEKFTKDFHNLFEI